MIGLVLALILALAQLAAEAQQAGKIYHVGFLFGASSSSPSVAIEPFKQTLRERGWVEGQNLRFAFQYANGRYERLPSMVHELLNLGVDVNRLDTSSHAALNCPGRP